jgi:hypothetical protein
MEIPEVTLEELLITGWYLVVTYRSGEPSAYRVYDGVTLDNNKQYFSNGLDYDGSELTYRFFLLPKKVQSS